MLRILVLMLFPVATIAQDLNVEYDKNRDMSRYKTFHFGEAEITTPEDQRQIDEAQLHELIKTAIQRELVGKGLQQLDSSGDLVVSYIAGSTSRTDIEPVGPLGMTPGSSATTWSRDYRLGSIVIDLNDRSNNLIWRITATASGDIPIVNLVNQVVASGFKKFSLKPKKVKKKK